MSAYTRRKAKAKYRERIRLERAQNQPKRIPKTPYERVKQWRERKKIKAAERINDALSTSVADTTDTGASQSDHSSQSKSDIVARIKTKVEAVDPQKAHEVGGVFLFNIIKGTSIYSWTLDLNKVTVYEGEPEEDPDTTFTLNEHYFKLLIFAKEDPRAIMQAGKCSVTGDIMRAMKLEPYIKLE